MVVTLYLSIHPLLVHGVLEPIPAFVGWEAGAPCHIETGNHSPSHSHLSPAKLTPCMFFGLWRKLGCPERTHTYAGLLLKLYKKCLKLDSNPGPSHCDVIQRAAFSMKAWLGSWKNKTEIYVPAVKEKKKDLGEWKLIWIIFCVYL